MGRKKCLRNHDLSLIFKKLNREREREQIKPKIEENSKEPKPVKQNRQTVGKKSVKSIAGSLKEQYNWETSS